MNDLRSNDQIERNFTVKERDPRIAEAANKAAVHFSSTGWGFPNTGKINAYQCEYDPVHIVVTVDREPGVTPFTIQCPICEALGQEAKPGESLYRFPSMQSSFYRVHPGRTPTHEFYRPDTLEGLSAGAISHVLHGGLLFRKIAQDHAYDQADEG